MATTQEVLDAARKVGQLLATHSAAQRMDNALRKLQGDREAQRVLTDFNRMMQAVAQKEAQGRPIEVDDKRKLEAAQSAVATNLLLRELQVAQMEYLELMRQIDELIEGEAGVEAVGPAGPASPPAAKGPASSIITG
jgi:cell fate (sporulation/competence/biofilm development) regulator YlbF (YheA/YmcA/DUF963 family)